MTAQWAPDQPVVGGSRRGVASTTALGSARQDVQNRL